MKHLDSFHVEVNKSCQVGLVRWRLTIQRILGSVLVAGNWVGRKCFVAELVQVADSWVDRSCFVVELGQAGRRALVGRRAQVGIRAQVGRQALVVAGRIELIRMTVTAIELEPEPVVVAPRLDKDGG